MNLATLTTAISDLHELLRGAAVSSVNKLHTMRNWLIGRYIVDYEQKGEDRATYGAGLLRCLSEKLGSSGLKGFSTKNLMLFRQFYIEYRQLGAIFISGIGQLPTDQFTINSITGGLPDVVQIQHEPVVELS